MRVPSGKIDQKIAFVALDATDRLTRETGLSGFTVYRSRNGGAATAYTTPTVAEVDATNMPGVYTLLIDEDTTIGANSDSEEYVVHITCTGMDPVTRSIELYRPDLAAVVEAGFGVQDVLKLMLALVAGKKDGFDGVTVHVRNPADTKNRITLSLGSTGWTAVATDLT